MRVVPFNANSRHCNFKCLVWNWTMDRVKTKIKNGKWLLLYLRQFLRISLAPMNIVITFPRNDTPHQAPTLNSYLCYLSSQVSRVYDYFIFIASVTGAGGSVSHWTKVLLLSYFAIRAVQWFIWRPQRKFCLQSHTTFNNYSGFHTNILYT